VDPTSIGIRDIVNGLRSLGLTKDSAVMVHASLSSFGRVRGGSAALLGALLWTCDTVVLPAFTCQTMVWPLEGPPDNGMTYGGPEHAEINRNAVLFRPSLPVPPEIGAAPELLRKQSFAVRSMHPVLSFVAAGRRAAEALAGQTLDHPLAPIEWLQHQGGDVVLIGVGHTRNTSIHFAEKLADRKQFLRWAIEFDEANVEARAVRLTHFPGCSDGFDALNSEIAHATQQATIGNATVQRIPLQMLIPIVVGWISEEPEALLCARPDCERCNAVRLSLHQP
jgi:aminoglycoside 3-N-acetyltransferase